MKFRLLAGVLLAAVLGALYLLHAADEGPSVSGASPAIAPQTTADNPFRIVDR